MNHWLMKTEPNNYSIDDLMSEKNTQWEGVRNYQARNFMRDKMKKGDPVLIYHSACRVPSVVGLALVSKESYPDPTQFDSKSRYFDPKATIETPRWFLVDIKFVKKLNSPISLKILKEQKELAGMALTKKGDRLSISPVSKAEYDFITSAFTEAP